MAWRTIVAVIIFIFTMVVFLPLTTMGLPNATEALNGTGDYDSRYVDGNSAMSDMVEAVYNGILVGVFGIIAWAIAWYVRKENTLGKLGPPRR